MIEKRWQKFYYSALLQIQLARHSLLRWWTSHRGRGKSANLHSAWFIHNVLFLRQQCCNVICPVSVQHPHSVTVLSFRRTFQPWQSVLWFSSTVDGYHRLCQNNYSSFTCLGLCVFSTYRLKNTKCFKLLLVLLLLINLTCRNSRCCFFCVLSGTASTMRRCLTLWTWAPLKSKSSPATTRLLKRLTLICSKCSAMLR